MHNVLPFPLQPKMKLIQSPSVGPDAPWWLQHMAEEDRVVFWAARARVLEALKNLKEETYRPNRARLREQVAGGVHACAVKTDLPLDLVIDDLAAAAELTAEEMASPHMGRTPWRKRILRETTAERKAAQGRPRRRSLR